MNIREMTRKDFEALPHREWDEDIEFDCLVILPMEEKHDGGYRCMDFVAVVGNEAKYLLSRCSDILYINGIGGFGKDWVKKYGGVPEAVPPVGWVLDCLPKSGLLRIWPDSRRMICEHILSSFKIFSTRRER